MHSLPEPQRLESKDGNLRKVNPAIIPTKANASCVVFCVLGQVLREADSGMGSCVPGLQGVDRARAPEGRPGGRAR